MENKSNCNRRRRQTAPKAHKIFITTLLGNNIVSYEKRCGTLGHARHSKIVHKLNPRKDLYIMLGIEHNHPRGTKKWLRLPTSLDGLHLFGNQGYARHSKIAHKLKPHRHQYLMLDIS